jgi:hypothetical protein
MAEKKSKLAEIKTKETLDSVTDFLNSLEHEQKRQDSFALLEMMQAATGEEAKIWGKGLIGFGNKRFKSPASGREVDWFLVGFAPRKANLSIYLMLDTHVQATLLENLGKHKTDGGCVYLQKLADVDLEVLKVMIATALDQHKSK